MIVENWICFKQPCSGAAACRLAWQLADFLKISGLGSTAGRTVWSAGVTATICPGWGCLFCHFGAKKNPQIFLQRAPIILFICGESGSWRIVLHGDSRGFSGGDAASKNGEFHIFFLACTRVVFDDSSRPRLSVRRDALGESSVRFRQRASDRCIRCFLWTELVLRFNHSLLLSVTLNLHIWPPNSVTRVTRLELDRLSESNVNHKLVVEASPFIFF